ncbi:MAG: sn-glycerol-3-phosphate ABC transporter permease UgpA [Gammaproteobacteria bacterium CG11_big_fil_rev_8_21_14_0_20_46_22]|nr:MAG: sn-glycerol-3-phosphate ABC transporter permease UgpA [Gammaproteobacteria bacterium CG12_big_fil_rev_8_21_14_0_65_46_12]PIR11239.1 MAG: sn-glycerol-3-phosphate ABC transporter permease UgpA [Gammaproteobacteria bacterium CG11_big_fil_rev_8_21_14_0_20_46_22]
MNSQVIFKNKLLPVLLILPQILITLVFFIWPAFEALWQSFFIEDPMGFHQHFVGLKNFAALFASHAYLYSIVMTLVFSVCVTVLTMAGGLLFSVLVNRVTRGQKLYMLLLMWPYAVAPAVAGILLRFMFDPAIGIAPYLLRHVGIHWDYHVSAYQALLLIILVAVWQQTSYSFLFYLAALQGVPDSLHEAAAMDGANAWQRFWHVTFPLLSPTTFFLVVMNMLYAFFDTFGIIQIVTQGGPANATQTLVYKVYNDGFVGLDFGSSAAQSVILMLVIVGLMVIQFRVIEKRVHY